MKKYSILFPFADSAVVTNSHGILTSLAEKQGTKMYVFFNFLMKIH